MSVGNMSLINLSKLDFLTKTVDDIFVNLMVQNSIDVDFKATPPAPKAMASPPEVTQSDPT
eukprot:1195849-Prorocentrum_minimum.AAC.3